MILPSNHLAQNFFCRSFLPEHSYLISHLVCFSKIYFFPAKKPGENQKIRVYYSKSWNGRSRVFF